MLARFPAHFLGVGCRLRTFAVRALGEPVTAIEQ